MKVGAFAKRTHAARKANPPQPILKRTANAKRNPPIPAISSYNKNPQAPEPKELITLDFTPVEAKHTEHNKTHTATSESEAAPSDRDKHTANHGRPCCCQGHCRSEKEGKESK